MARRREFDDATVVRLARDVFWRRGYAATSLSDLEEATGLNRSSLYGAYGSKRTLFARATEDYLQEITYPMLAPVEADGAGRDELVGYFLGLAEIVRRLADCNRTPGCLVLNTAVELYALDEQAAEVVRQHRAHTKAAFLHALTRTPGLAVDADAKAELLTVAQIGILVTSRVDAEAAARLAQMQAHDIQSW